MKGHVQIILALAFAGVTSCPSTPAVAQESATSVATSHTIRDHALNGKLTVLSRHDDVVAITFENRKDGQVVAFPKAIIDAVNGGVRAARDRAGPGPMKPPVVNITWVQDMPGGGSVYSASVGDVVVALSMVQPNGDVEFAAL